MERRPDFLIFFAIVTLLGIGIVMVFSASSISATIEFDDSSYYLKKQIIAAAIGILAMLLFMQIDYRRLKKWAPVALLIALALLGLVLVEQVGVEGGGATRWLHLGPFNLQPSEVAKISTVLFMAAALSSRRIKITDFFRGLLPLAAMLGILFLLILKQPDLGTAITLVATTVVMLYASGAKAAHLLGLAVCSLPVLWWAVVGEKYRLQRFLAFLNPEADPLDTGFHIIQSLYAIGSGGLLGVGLGQSRQKFLYLPERHTDFIFAIIGEELGLLGTLFVLGLFMLFAWRGCRAAMLAPDRFGILLGTGIVAMVSIQALVNIGVVTGSMPITGIPLPFISYGGSSLVFTLAAVGILLNISRHGTGSS
ncbi:MAG: putative lipid II flippase FtsW [Firmicutes bacterium]|nr:putative lipid II flippase FtsW [Bacillota bacterium]